MNKLFEIISRIVDLFERKVVIHEEILTMQKMQHAKAMRAGLAPPFVTSTDPNGCECKTEAVEEEDLRPTDKDLPPETETEDPPANGYKTEIEKLREEATALDIKWTKKTSSNVLKKKIHAEHEKLTSLSENAVGDTIKVPPSPAAPSGDEKTKEPTTIEECREVIMDYHNPSAGRDGQKLIKEITTKDTLGEVDDPAVFDKLIAAVKKIMEDS